MPRANRYYTRGYHYHVTHRCHNRSFLLKFVKDRDLYRSMLRERLGHFCIDLLGYCITSNHVHLVLTAPDRDRLARLMQSLAGDFAQAYNIRKKRSGAFWGDRYHATQIEGGGYLWNCLKYVDMNMVRAGVVNQPSEWPWCGYRELSGQRKRYRLIEPRAVMQALGDRIAHKEFMANYDESIRQAIANREFNRQAMWSETLAVGQEAFVRKVERTLKNRRRREVVEPKHEGEAWILKEEQPQYA